MSPVDIEEIFKAYDIRGLTDGQLTEEAARLIGSAFAAFVGADAVAVGYDIRHSSPGLAAAFREGVNRQGVDVVGLGLMATDMIYYAAGAFDMPGAMITASHNPKEYNGIKLCREGAQPIGVDSGLTEIKALVYDPPRPADVPGTQSEKDVRAEYVNHLFEIVDASVFTDMRVAVDAGNGMAGVVIESVFDRIPSRLHGLYLDPDGDFPNHHPDPLRPENLEDLLREMDRGEFDLGVAFDGDADRAFFIDDKGVALPGSTTTAIAARWFLAREPGATIVHNLICSKAVPETVEALGGTAIRTRVGHSYIKEVMKDSGAVFGGEHSGHYYFRDNFRADSGMLAMLVLMQVMAEDGRKLSEIRTEVEPYEQSGEINFRVEDKEGMMNEIAERLGGEADYLDGLTLTFDDSWLNLRASNTEPVLRLNVEGPDQGAVDEIVEKVSSVISAAGGHRV